MGAKKNLLISLMREYYNELTKRVRPVPNDQEKIFSIDQIFIDHGLEGLTYTAEDSIGMWERIDSYQIMFTDSRFVGKRRLLQGKAGFGKSTIALKIAFDWCNNSIKSPLSEIEMFFLVRLREAGFSKSIYTQLKHNALPRDAPLSGNDIKRVLDKNPSALIMLDDLDCYTDVVKDENSDVIRTVQGKMLGGIDVIITSTGVPKQCVQGTKHLRLSGFDDKTQDKYIRKVAVADDLGAAEKVKQALRKNSVMNDFCKIPFYFIVFAHKNHWDNQFQVLSNDEELSEFILNCFHCHLTNRFNDIHNEFLSVLDQNNQALGKIAFERLCGNDEQVAEKRQNYIYSIGQYYYNYYVQMGILVEQDILDSDIGYGKSPSSKTEYEVTVNFFSFSFLNWYAAYYIAKGGVHWSSQEMKSAVESSSYLQNLYQHAKNYREFSIFWICEKEPGETCVLAIVKELCSRMFKFNSNQKETLQRAMSHLLEIASRNKISISHVWLGGCYSTVDLSGGNHLQLKSNLSIPVLTTLNKLTIHTLGEGREITAEEFTGILQYSSKCLALKELWLRWCLLPQYVQAEYVSILRTRNVTVTWVTPTYSEYKLNLQSCHWERIDERGNVTGVMTDNDYQKAVETVREEQRKLRRWRGDYD